MADWRALIVEDEDDSAEVVTRILDFHRKTYSVANTAEEALTLLESEIPDVFIVDLALPDLLVASTDVPASVPAGAELTVGYTARTTEAPPPAPPPAAGSIGSSCRRTSSSATTMIS